MIEFLVYLGVGILIIGFLWNALVSLAAKIITSIAHHSKHGVTALEIMHYAAFLLRSWLWGTVVSDIALLKAWASHAPLVPYASAGAAIILFWLCYDTARLARNLHRWMDSRSTKRMLTLSLLFWLTTFVIYIFALRFPVAMDNILLTQAITSLVYQLLFVPFTVIQAAIAGAVAILATVILGSISAITWMIRAARRTPTV